MHFWSTRQPSEYERHQALVVSLIRILAAFDLDVRYKLRGMRKKDSQ